MSSSGCSALRGALCLLMVSSSCRAAEREPTPHSANTPARSAPAVAGAAPVVASAAPKVATTSAPSAPWQAPPNQRSAYHLAVIGDSLSDPRVAGGGYLRYLKEKCPETRIDNFAKGGAMVNQMRKTYDRFVGAVPQGSFSHLVVFGGVNDLYSDLTAGRTPNKVQADLSYLYENAVQKGMKVVALTVAPWGGFTRYYNERRAGYTETLNEWIRAQAGEQVAVVIDAYALLSCGEPDKLCKDYQQRTPDGLHPGKAGHDVLGKALYEQAFADCR